MPWSEKGAQGYVPAALGVNRQPEDIHRLGAGIHSPALSRSSQFTVPAEGSPVVEISLWHQCLRRLETELPEQAFNTWVRPLQAVEDGSRLRLLAPNRFVVDWVNQNCAARIGELVDELVPAPVPQVVVEIGSRRPVAPAPAPLTDGAGLPTLVRPPVENPAQPLLPSRRTRACPAAQTHCRSSAAA